MATLGGLSSLNLLATLALSAGQARAQSQVNVYGVVGAPLVYTTGTTTLRKVNSNSIVDSRLGFKGEEALGRRLNPNDSHLCGLFVCGGYAGFYHFPGFGHASAFIDNAVNYSSPGGMPFKASVMVAPSEGPGRCAAGAGNLDLGPVATLSLDDVMHEQKNSANDANFVRLVDGYQLSKRTRLNANLIRLNNKGASALALAGATVAAGQSQSVLTAGMAHSF